MWFTSSWTTFFYPLIYKYKEDTGETIYSMAALHGRTPEEQEEYEKKLDKAKAEAEALQKKVDDAQAFAARVDCSLELEAVQKENERLKAELQALRKSPGQTPEQPRPRRGRPPKKKDEVRSLAEELASMAPKD